MLTGPFSLPSYIDLGATFLFALSGAMVAIRRRYDVVGLFALALVTGVGGALIRDGLFIQNGPPTVMKDARYLLAVLAGCLAAGLFGHHMARLQKVFLLADALGLGAYAVVGLDRGLGASLSMAPAILVGVVNACGGGLLRDILVRDEPMMFKPGQFYALAALAGAALYALALQDSKLAPAAAAFLAIGGTFLIRMLAIVFNWKTTAMWQEPSLPPAVKEHAAPAAK